MKARRVTRRAASRRRKIFAEPGDGPTRAFDAVRQLVIVRTVRSIEGRMAMGSGGPDGELRQTLALLDALERAGDRGITRGELVHAG
jgi:hypothetical protein